MHAGADVECLICCDTVPATAAMALCGSHRFCAECCWRCCESALGDGLVPACPFDKQHKCGTVSKELAVEALTRWLTCADGSVRESTLMATNWGVCGSAGTGYSSAKLEAVYLSAERARAGAVQCIGQLGKQGAACMAFYVPPKPHSLAPQRLQCTVPACGASFCSACRLPFHFRSTCAEALRIHAKWIKFLQEELPAFLKVAIVVDGERWAKVLERHTKAKGALDDATREALSRFDELRKMELWKEKHCRRCPSCLRVVEKMSGCDMMTCGADNHGGNQQRGCGKPFVWTDGQPNSALPYQADLRGAADYAADDQDGSGAGEEDGAMRTRRLQRDAREEHQVRPGVPVRCDGCAEPIVGPRLQCVQVRLPSPGLGLCPPHPPSASPPVQCEGGVELCVGCVAQDAGSKALRLSRHGGSKHPKQHVFRRVRQTLLDVGLDGSSATPSAAALVHEQQQQQVLGEAGVLMLTAANVGMRPGLSTAAAAAAAAAADRAMARATAAATAAASAAAVSVEAGRSASAAHGSASTRPPPPAGERGSRKRAASPERGAGRPRDEPSKRGGAAVASASGRAAHALPRGAGAARGATSSEPIELSSDGE